MKDKIVELYTQGITRKEISNTLGVSYSTVKKHTSGLPSNIKQTAYRCRTCDVTGSENFYSAAKYQCKSCWNKRSVKSGKDKITTLKLEYGGKCSICGYDKCLNALEFHHTDPTKKEFHLGERRGLNIEALRIELDKCIIVCSNCHAEIHST